MLSKTEHPHLNRQQRRHPERLMRLLSDNLKGSVASNWLLAGLFIRAGISQRVNAEGAQV